MNNIPLLSHIFSFFRGAEQKQAANSLVTKVITVGLQGIALLAGMLILSKVLGLHTLGTTIGLPLSALYITFLLANICTKQMTNPRRDDNSSPPSDGRCLFQAAEISYDMCLYIASFLDPRDVFQLMQVSKEFHSITQSNVIWNKFLTRPNSRIWGATRWAFTHNRKRGYYFQPAESAKNKSSFDQLRAYHELCKEAFDDFSDYLARLMRGGPIAFQAIPQVQVTNLSDLNPNEMTASIIRGKDQHGHCFFALRVINRAHEDAIPVVLIFIKENKKWTQKANAHWEENRLNVSCKNTLNYILALVNQTPLTDREDFKSPLLIKTIELA